MRLVEQHLIRTADPCYAAIDAAAFASKNVYNQANYQIRQAFLHEGTYLPSAEIFHRIKQMDCYQALPAKVANSILILLAFELDGLFCSTGSLQSGSFQMHRTPQAAQVQGQGERAQRSHL